MREKRLIVVSNRLPVTVQEGDCGLSLEHSSGGLVTALCPILRQRSGCWIGWTGTAHNSEIEELVRERKGDNYEMVPIFLSDEEKVNFYHGFSNEILWPLFHDLQSRCNFEPGYWNAYRRVNARFAETLSSFSEPHDFVWVQDYHLMLVAKEARSIGLKCELAYFHHIPFPSLDIFEKLPWRAEILQGLLSYDLLGFQTERDRRNFVACAQQFVPASTGRSVIGSFPIGIDFNEFATGADDPGVVERSAQIRRDLSECRIVLGIDRLDYTKGIPERLRAFQTMLQQDETRRGKVTLIQVVVPSRSDIPKYCELRLEIERLVSSINGRFGGPGWMPVHYVHRQLPRAELLAYYRAADVALITPLKDGMNLVAKEYCAARTDEQGVLILSEFAGAASQLNCGAMLVNPNDTLAVAEAIRLALVMELTEQRQRMRRLRQRVREQDVYWWSKRFFSHGDQGRPARRDVVTGNHVPMPPYVGAII